MSILDTPPWLIDAAQFYSDCIGAGEWGISVGLELCLNDSSTTAGICYQSGATNEARIEFRADIQDTQYWHSIIIHELIHVLHTRIDSFVGIALGDQDEKQHEMYCNIVYEPFVENLAKHLAATLYPLYCQKFKQEPDTSETEEVENEELDAHSD